VLGANGRGKSTLLDTLTGVLPPLSGRAQCTCRARPISTTSLTRQRKAGRNDCGTRATPPSHCARPLACRPGEIWAVLGANGRGKSTLLDTLTGVLPPLGKEIHVPGAAHQHHIAHSPAESGTKRLRNQGDAALDTLTGVLPPLSGRAQCEGGVALVPQSFRPAFRYFFPGHWRPAPPRSRRDGRPA
jgi:ABC-type cobalamin/Fe3+-siderophores transport system ATPase subunit